MTADAPDHALLTIPISHYCEKARWALDRAGLAYREIRHLQMFHWPFAWMWARTPMVPILRTPTRTIADSVAILHAIDETLPAARRLYPDDARLRQQVEALEVDFGDRLGVETRRWMYFEAFRHRGFDLSFMAAGAPALERAALPLVRLVARPVLRRRLDVTEQAVTDGRAVILETLDRVDGMLADGRRFLVGDRFTAADLSFACMLAPCLLPRNYGSPLPTLVALPTAVAEAVDPLRDRPAFRFGARMFAEQRVPIAPGSS